MAEYYPAGYQIPLVNGSDAVIVKKLGEGGQGVVYRVSVGGREYALKWYHKGAVHNPKKFYQNLESNISKGAPTKAFLWPLYLTKPVDGSFGYVMDLRPQNFREFSDFLLAKVHFQSLSAAVNAALNITNGFRELHRNGFSYQDLNDGNFFIDPATGEVLICDNDNVAPYGESLGIAGKARYMAPEVVRNMTAPNVMTDRFSLAVVLFRLLFLDHPLEGKRVVEAPCLTEELELKFYGKDPVFMFDPGDDRNRPVRGVHANAIRFWPMYPKFIQNKFIEALSKDAMTGNAPRMTDNDWQIAFTRLRDTIITCPCGSETFINVAGDANCCGCGQKIPKPPVLNCHNHKYGLALFPGMKLYRCHIDKGSDNFTEVIGEVSRNPKNPGVWGLRNVSDVVWNVETQDGGIRPVEKGQVAPIAAIRAIHFPNGDAVVELSREC
ncbi:serine/threonine protein kinase [Ruminococcus champanellensis]|uniref:serine/threonine protein kinase n=1 Tax=Ruminococcus champanellensis TaxID=1161942 RepID=UPI0023F43F8A|nr:serine/threonine-protein kinase [Ruminococcus champanellensis]